MDVASFVFGALPIALKALENYEHCLKPAKNYWKYENTLKQIQMHVFVQQEQLKATMVGLDVDLDSLTTDKLRHQLRLAYTKNKCEHFIGILERMKKLLEEMLDKLDVDVAGKPKWSDESAERAHWEWRKVKRSFGDKKRKELIDELQ